jgi:hypothetical protein
MHASSPAGRFSSASPSLVTSVGGAPVPAHMTQTTKPKPKPTNVFTNDGSFLERVLRSKKGEEGKLKEEDLANRKKNFDNRFKNRGKRARPEDEDENENANSTASLNEASPTSTDGDGGTPMKRSKTNDKGAALDIKHNRNQV